MSLYHKYRPTSLSDVKGNVEVVTSLTNMLKNKSEFPHSLLLHGPTGCGKTTVARIVARELGAVGLDYKEIDSADFRGIDMVREIRKNSRYQPLEGACRVWVIDECHKLTNDAQNAFLKLLEDTPKHVYLILCTTEPEKLISTIRGRCMQLQMKPLSDTDMSSLLRIVARGEGERLEREVLDQLIMDGLGLPRNALQVLEQVLAVPGEQRLEVAKRSAEQQSQIIELCRVLMKGVSWQIVREILNGLKGEDAETIRRSVLGYCQAVLLKSANDRAALVMEEFYEPFYNIGFPGLVYACYSVIKT